MKTKIIKALRNLAIPPHILGYEYLKTAIEICIEDKTAIHKITKVVYPQVAKTHLTTASRVERAIRHSIELSLTRVDREELNKYFYIPKDSKLTGVTNSEYIASIVEVLRMDKENENE